MGEESGRPNLYGLARADLVDLFAPLDPAAYRAKQAYRAMYCADRLDPLDWTDQPLSLRREIARRFRVARPTVSERVPARDGTTKFLLELPGGDRVECVAIPAPDRMTFCISSQVGCGFGCAFCMTAKLGLIRNLTPGEIVGQIAALLGETGAQRGAYNIVFMGMGEPLHNLPAVDAALDILFDGDGFGLGPRRVTVSTVGLVKGIRQLAARAVRPRLAVSLVTADPELRARLMPVARTVGLEQLVDAVRAFGSGQRDRPTFEVVMLRDVNDRPLDAALLAELAVKARAKVNLIEFNPTPELAFEPASEGRIQMFLSRLAEAGVVGTVRRSRGKDIRGACGQLAFGETPSPPD